MTNAIFSIVIAALAIIIGIAIGNLFAITSIGDANLYFAIAGSIVSSVFAIDFIKNEIYSKE